jgi:hypothetical protein
MQKSSMRQNMLVVAGLYMVSLVVAAGCPQSQDRTAKKPEIEAPIQPIQLSTDESATVEPSVENESTATAEHDPPVDNSHNKLEKPKVDPVAQNGEYFVGWPKPKLAILVSGRQDGYLEPCGCAGLENQKGGLSRRYTLIEQLREKGWPLVAVDVGNSVRRFGKQAEIQFAIAVEALKKMGYNAATFGTDDLRLSSGEVAAAVAGPEPGQSLFVSANANLFDLVPKVQLFEENGIKVGVTSVFGDSYRNQVNNAEIEIKPAAEALQEVVSQLAGCNVRILLAHTTQAEAIELAKTHPDFDFVVCSEGGDEPPYLPKEIEGTKNKLIEVGHKGMYCVVLGIFDDKESPFRYQRVALDARYPDSNQMKQLMTTYQEQLQELGWAGLGLKPIFHPQTKSDVEGSGKFVGAETCKDCHSTAWEIWSKTGHAHATDSLVKLNPPRQHDPECISCHAVGWNPQEYFAYTSGFESIEKTPHLQGNQCENCHGPGGAHVAAEMEDLANKVEQRNLMRLTKKDAEAHFCAKCHDIDNSPEFSKPGAFERYWKEVEHYGKD